MTRAYSASPRTHTAVLASSTTSRRRATRSSVGARSRRETSTSSSRTRTSSGSSRRRTATGVRPSGCRRAQTLVSITPAVSTHSFAASVPAPISAATAVLATRSTIAPTSSRTPRTPAPRRRASSARRFSRRRAPACSSIAASSIATARAAPSCLPARRPSPRAPSRRPMSRPATPERSAASSRRMSHSESVCSSPAGFARIATAHSARTSRPSSIQRSRPRGSRPTRASSRTSAG